MSALQLQMHRIEHKLGAWMVRDEDFADHPGNPADFETKARTLLCFLENVFGRFYEFKTRVCDYEDVPDTYGADWDRFKSDACIAARDARPFNGICAVMHLQMRPEGGAYVIENLGIRPCAMEQSFLRVLLKNLALNMADKRQLVFRLLGIRAEFISAVMKGLMEAHQDMHDLLLTKRDASKAGGKDRQADIYTFESVAALRGLNVPWNTSADAAFPTAEALNDSAKANPERVELLRRMMDRASDEFAQHLKGANDTTNYLPDALNLDENGLWVYKGGVTVLFRPDERRFFMRDMSRYREVCWGEKADRLTNNADFMQSGKTIRVEFAMGDYVFFLLPKDFARRRVLHKQTIQLSGRDEVLQIMKALIFDGEKIVGMDGDALVLSASSEAGGVVAVWNPTGKDGGCCPEPTGR